MQRRAAARPVEVVAAGVGVLVPGAGLLGELLLAGDCWGVS